MKRRDWVYEWEAPDGYYVSPGDYEPENDDEPGAVAGGILALVVLIFWVLL